MKRIQKISFFFGTIAIGMIAALGTAQAQVTSTGTNQGIVDLTLMGTIQSSLVLAIDGTGTTVLNPVSSQIMNTHSTATVDFGTFSTQQAIALGNGKLVRTTGTLGAFAVAELSATATYSGNPGGAGKANINLTTVTPGGGSSPIAAGNTKVQSVLPADWTNSANGTAVATAAPGTSICPNGNNTTGDCASGVGVGHELAVFVPDTQAAGNFTQVVTYTATAY
jgi:hypothetical protein